MNTDQLKTEYSIGMFVLGAIYCAEKGIPASEIIQAALTVFPTFSEAADNEMHQAPLFIDRIVIDHQRGTTKIWLQRESEGWTVRCPSYQLNAAADWVHDDIARDDGTTVVPSIRTALERYGEYVKREYPSK